MTVESKWTVEQTQRYTCRATFEYFEFMIFKLDLCFLKCWQDLHKIIDSIFFSKEFRPVFLKLFTPHTTSENTQLSKYRHFKIQVDFTQLRSVHTGDRFIPNKMIIYQMDWFKNLVENGGPWSAPLFIIFLVWSHNAKFLTVHFHLPSTISHIV